eukprot:TRINITY_DN2386_c0_g1_i2.p1 TRINITY_DN2386_c0_g1~~TRINITY_DN2386_c0_g1_i2.p1  ORF type:complete len:511 (+),score=75.44 TRINITY_DN2386_c0_g1_i2:498-2030(+)
MMSETSTQYSYYRQKYLPIRKALSQELGTFMDFHHFYSPTEFDRRARIHNRKHIYKECFLLHSTKKEEESRVVVVHCEPHFIETINVLRKHGIHFLILNHYVEFCRDPVYGNLIFITSMRNAMAEYMTKVEAECWNGLLLDEENNFALVSMSLEKVFDYFDILRRTSNHEAKKSQSELSIDRLYEFEILPKFDWSEVKTFENLDGILLSLYYYNGEWRLSSQLHSCKPQATIGWKKSYEAVSASEKTLDEVFWKLWETLGYQLPKDTNKCYSFVMTTNEIRFLVNHKSPGIRLVGVRDINSGREVEFGELGIENGWGVSEFRVMTVEDSLENMLKECPWETKGYIFSDKTHRRLALHSSIYISLVYGSDFQGIGGFNFTGDIDPKIMSELIKFRKDQLYLAYFPKWTDYCEKMKSEIFGIYTLLQEMYNILEVKYPTMEAMGKNVLSLPPKFSALLIVVRKMRKEDFWVVSEYFSNLIYKAVVFVKVQEALQRLQVEGVDVLESVRALPE